MFWVLWVSQAISTKIDSISIDSISVGKFDVYLHAKQLTSSTFNFHLILTNQLSWDITKILANLLFQVIWAGLAIIADNTDVYFNATNSNLTLASFLRYCWSIANLLFWVLWACLTTLTKNNINFGRYSTQECVLTMVETCKKSKRLETEHSTLLTDFFKTFDCLGLESMNMSLGHKSQPNFVITFSGLLAKQHIELSSA